MPHNSRNGKRGSKNDSSLMRENAERAIRYTVAEERRSVDSGEVDHSSDCRVHPIFFPSWQEPVVAGPVEIGRDFRDPARIVRAPGLAGLRVERENGHAEG